MDGHLKVRVQPRAGRDDVEVVEGERLRVRVTAPAEAGKANEALVACWPVDCESQRVA